MWNSYTESAAARQARESARQARDVSREAAIASRLIEDRIDRLSLICRAMWEFLQERTDLTEEQLMAKVQEIDLRDGAADGKLDAKPTACPACARPLSRRHIRCLYCGAEVQGNSAFDTL